MHMSFRLLAWNNLKRNARAYVPYYLSSSLMITIFFVYAVFIFHPDVSNVITAANVKKGLQVADLLIFVFSFFSYYTQIISLLLHVRKNLVYSPF